jgi:hypothetical protein
MSDAAQTQTKKETAGSGAAKSKAEKEPRQLQTFATLGGDFTGPAPDESLTDGSADGWNSGASSILSHEPSTLLMRRISPGQTEGTKSARASAVMPTFGGRNFCNIPTHASTRPAIQPKLTVGAANDPSEQEADQVAEQVMRMPAPVAAPPGGADAPEPGGNSVQHAPEEEDEIQTKPLAATIRPFVQRTTPQAEDEAVQRAGEDENELQTKRVSAADSFEVGSDFENRVAGSGGGSPLPAETRAFMEPRFGADFSGVRLHSGGEAADLNRSVSAQAFTLGRDIYLGEGKTDVASDGGKHLLAHELTHVVQQGGAGQLQRSWTGLLQKEAVPAAETTGPTDAEKAAAAAKARAAKEQAAAARERARVQQAKARAEADAKREAGKVPSQKVAASIAVGPVNSQAKEALQAAAVQKAKQAAEEHAAKTQVTKAATNAATATAQSALTDTRAAAPKGGSLPKAAAGDKSSGNGSGGLAAVAAAHTTVEAAMTPKNLGPQTPAQDAGYQTVIKTVNTVSQEQQTHKPAQSEASAAQAAVVQPVAEVTGLAEANQVSQMERTETPGFDAAGFKAKLMERIAALAPKSSQEADEFKEKDTAGALSGELQTQTGQERDKSTAPLEQTTAAAPDTSSIPPKEVTPLPPVEPGQVPGAVGAENAAPKPKAAAEVEQPLQQSSQAVDAEMTQAGVTQEQLANSNEPQFTAALDSKNQAQAQVEQAPAAYCQSEQGQISSAETAATAVAQEKMQAMQTDRAALLNQVTGKQTDAKTQDEQARSKVAADIQKIYEESKGKVETILSGLDTKVSTAFDAGAQAAKQAFEDYVDARMDAYKEERYGGMFGWAQWLADKIMGMPGEVNTFYTEGRQLYLDQMNAVIDNVVSIIGTTLTEAKAEIAQGKKHIQEYVAQLPEDLKQVGQDAAQNIQSQFDTLEQSVNDKQNDLIDTLANKYQENLQAIDARITEMKAANKGLIDAVIEAVGDVIQTIIKLKDMLLNILARAAAAIDKIITDPIGFLSHLVDAIKLGVQNFLANIGTHLQQGLIAWLTGTIAEAGITLPEKFDLPGIFQLVLQVLGLTMDKIRARVTGLLGFDLFGIIDKVVEIVNVVQTDGLEGLVKYGLAQLLGQEGANVLLEVVGTFQAVLSGDFSKLWELFQKHLGDLQALVLDQIKNFVIEKIITAGITWVISLLNPAGAFVRACKAIYDIVMFFVEHGQQIIALVNAVIDSITAIASGNIAGAAKTVEDALAKAIPVTIGFLASLLGLGDIGARVQEIIKKIQGLVDQALDAIFNSGPVQMVAKFIKKIIGKIKNGIESLKNKLGFGQKPGDGEIGKTVTFSAGEESHKLWVNVQGTTATLMMASTPMSVEERLAGWEARLADLSEEKRPEAKGLIDQARAQLTKTDQEGDTLAQEQTAENAKAAEDLETKDEALESDEDALARILTSILNIFVDEGADVIADWLGRKVVNRSDAGDDTLVDPSRTPTGYAYNNLQRLKRAGGKGVYIIIKRGSGNKDNAKYPAVCIDPKGVLAYGEAEGFSASDEEKIAEYQKVLRAAKIAPTTWPEIEEAEAYLRKMRQMVVAQYAGDLEGLDTDIISAKLVSASYNKAIGEIFEEWCEANKALVRRPAPEFILVSNDGELQKRVADAHIEGTTTLVEMKAISTKTGPTTEQKDQMKAYYRIISEAIPWIRGPETSDRVTFSIVRYMFNNQVIANEWKATLDELLPGVYESDPPCDPDYERKIDEAIEPYKQAAEGQTGATGGSGTPPVQRKAMDATPTGRLEPQNLEARVAGLQESGQPLPEAERTFFEERMGADFSAVRVHADSAAQETAQDLSARAFTAGQHVVLQPAEYQPGTPASRKLLAHELAHVVQQGGAAPRQSHGTGTEAALAQRTVSNQGLVVQRETDLEMLATTRALKRYEYTTKDGQTLKTVKEIIDTKFGAGSRDANYNNALKVEFEKELAVLVFDNLNLVAGTVSKISNNVLKYLTVHTQQGEDTIRLSLDGLDQASKDLQQTINSEQSEKFQSSLIDLMSKTKNQLGYIESFTLKENFGKFIEMLQSGPNSPNELAAHLNLHLRFYQVFFADDFGKITKTVQEGQEKIGAATQELVALIQEISVVARKYEQDKGKLSSSQYNPASTFQPEKQFLTDKQINKLPLEKLEQLLSDQDWAQLNQEGYQSLDEEHKKQELKKYIGRPRGERLTKREADGTWNSPAMSGPTRMPTDEQGRPQPENFEPLGGQDSPHQQGVSPYLRGGDLLRLNEASAWTQKARLELDMPLIAGTSGATSLMLTAALEMGLSGQDEKLEYALAVVGSVVGGGHHSFHEIMTVAQLAGVPYVEGDYASVLNAVPGALKGPIQALINNPKYAPLFKGEKHA